MDGQKRSIFLDIGLIVGSFILTAGILFWLSGYLENIADNILASRTAIRQQAQIMESMAQLRSIEPQIAQYESRLTAVLPKEEELLNFGRWVNELENTDRISATHRFSGINSPATGSAPGRMGLTITAVGDLRGIVPFFSSLQGRGRQYIVQITSYDVSQLSGGQFQVNARGNIFFRK